MISFNTPYYTGNEITYINDAMQRGTTAGNGFYSQACEELLCRRYGFKKAFLTTSGTDALELAALLINIQTGDEVIMPSFSFVSTANAFIIHGAKIVFADSGKDNPNVDIGSIEAMITPATKAIVIIHYAGIACDMQRIKQIADMHNIYLIEDSAQAIDSYYNDQPLGTIGHLATFSFHETKNISCGEGGLVVINSPEFIKRAEILREKGTNRSAFFRGEVDKYTWVDIGSSFLPSDILAAFLYAQLEKLDDIQAKRKRIWDTYYDDLLPLQETLNIQLPKIPEYASSNGHMFYLVFPDLELRSAYIDYMRENGVQTVFHYIALHDSPYFIDKHDGRELPMVKKYQDCLVRLPLWYDLSMEQVKTITGLTLAFLQQYA